MLICGLAVELGPHNIQVNDTAPGYFLTEMNHALIADPVIRTLGYDSRPEPFF